MGSSLFIATDHRGKWLTSGLISRLKEKSAEDNLIIQDLGGGDLTSDDFPLQATKLVRKLQVSGVGKRIEDAQSLGILICGSGLGILMAANKHRGIRASLYLPGIDYKFERAEHNSNVLVIAADNFLASRENNEKFAQELEKLVSDIIAWIAGDHRNAIPRYKRRVKQLRLIELSQGSDYPMIVPAILTADLQVFKTVISEHKVTTPLTNFDFIDGSLVQGRTISITTAVPELQSYQGLISIHSMNLDVEAEAKILSNLPNLIYFYIQVEAGLDRCERIAETEYSFLPVLSINAATKLTEEVVSLAQRFQAVQIMTVEAGAQGRTFQTSCLEKVNELRAGGFNGEIHLDGGISSDNIELIKRYEVDLCNVGSGYSSLAASDN